jgi:copper resistance protein B
VPNPNDRATWPSPVDDNAALNYVLVNQLEYWTPGNPDGARWDAQGWVGGDVTRLWWKTEGYAPPGTSKDREAEAQLLYGRLVRPFFDFQAGLRFVPGLGVQPARTYAVVGLQGLAPYNFDVEPSLFISQTGRVSLRFTGFYDLQLSQRLFLQPRLETNLGFQGDPAIRSGAGLNDIEFGVRLRYEIRRQVAPYVGFTFKQSFGQTRALLLQNGDTTSQTPVVFGVWFWH